MINRETISKKTISLRRGFRTLLRVQTMGCSPTTQAAFPSRHTAAELCLFDLPTCNHRRDQAFAKRNIEFNSSKTL